MDTVYMRHPKIGGPPAEVPKSAVPHYSAGGWEECEPPEPRKRRPSKQQNTTSTRTERRRTIRSSKED